MFAFGLPTNAWGWLLLALSCCLLVPGLRYPQLLRRRPSLVLALLCLSAAGLSLGYFYFYLGGSSRLIDATTYLYQARGLAEGKFCFDVEGPSAAFRSRFLVSSANDAQCVGGIFPAGYPALLSLGVALGHYEWVGPVLGAALVWVTYSLAFLITKRRIVAQIAGLFSVISGCLRYHTADTMSHGWSSLLTTTAVLLTVSLVQFSALPRPLVRDVARKYGVLLGACLGLLLATRQWTGVLVAAGCLGSLLFILRRQLALLARAGAFISLGVLPGIALLLAQHQALTQSLLISPQSYYYARADGPPGCFGLGLGKGCFFEHADAVAEQGGQGLTLLWALRTTVHRLHWHSLDIANFEPLLLIALWGAWLMRKKTAALPLLLVLFLIPAGYSMFYFNGSYPGGGARFFSEMIPLWHVFLAIGVFRLRAVRAAMAASLLGFALHASISHAQLALPHFGPKTLNDIVTRSHALGGKRPLLLVSAAHHLNLLSHVDPSVSVALWTHDARVQQLADAHHASGIVTLKADGTMAAQKSETAASGDPKGDPLTHRTADQDPSTKTQLVLESEYDYPVLDLRDAWIHPDYLPMSCVSLGRALRVHTLAPTAEVEFELSATEPGNYNVVAEVVVATAEGPACRRIDLGIERAPGRVWLPIPPELTHIDRLILTQPHQ